MENAFKDLQDLILLSLKSEPCTEEELGTRDFLKTISYYGTGMALQRLEKLDLVYYRKNSDVIRVRLKEVKKQRKYLLAE